MQPRTFLVPLRFKGMLGSLPNVLGGNLKLKSRQSLAGNTVNAAHFLHHFSIKMFFI